MSSPASEASEVLPHLGFQRGDGAVGGGADIEAEAHVAGDGVDAARAGREDAGRREGAVPGGQPVRVRDEAGGEEHCVSPGGEGRRARVPLCQVASDLVLFALVP